MVTRKKKNGGCKEIMIIVDKKYVEFEFRKVDDPEEKVIIKNCEVDNSKIKSIHWISQYSPINIADSKIENSKIVLTELANGDGWIQCCAQKCELSSFYLGQMKIEQCTVNKCKIKKSDHIALKMVQCTFIDNNVKEIFFGRSNMESCILENNKWFGYQFNKGEIKNCTFKDNYYEQAFWTETIFDNCSFDKTIIKGKMKKSTFNNVDFSSSNLEECLFIDCKFNNCTFTDEQKNQLGMET